MTITSFTAGLTACLLLHAGAGQAVERRITEADLNTRILLLDEHTERPRQVSDRRTFYDGQRFKLSVRPNQSGYLYVLCLTSLGEVRLLHPSTAGANRVERGQFTSFPERGWFRFDQDPGTEKMYVVLSPHPLADLDQAAEDGVELTMGTLQRYITPSAAGKGDDSSPQGIDTVNAVTWGVKQLELRHEGRDW